ncbi:lactate dehydrogenase/glycoside hydrolase [Mariannaea sp. PMI_226]|nr:lactate dehydrogenase/glycoside hydrolase [Mariannaea sp. PMI_226]
MSPTSKIAIIGAGQVGGAAGYALLLTSIASELLIVDTDTELRNGQVQDLCDVAYSNKSSTRVRAASYREAAQCDIVVITAGSRRTLGQTKIDYTSRNVSIIREVIDEMRPIRSDTILLVVAHPVDLLASLAQELSKLPTSQVIGSGTLLDSVRLRGLLSDHTGIAANSIDVYVLGVHGDAQVVAWSSATIGGAPIEKSLPTKTFFNRVDLENECKDRSQNIVRAKGSIPFGMGSIVCNICSSIILDKGTVRPISHFQPKFGCYFSLPAIIGRKGVVSTVDLPLSSDEEAKVTESAQELSSSIDWVHRDLE